MNKPVKQNCGCGLENTQPSHNLLREMLPMDRPPVKDEPCCGPPPGPPSDPNERPGYRLCSFVQGFMPTPVGPVPRIKTLLDTRDKLGTWNVRMGFGRNDYKVAPGLYAVGDPAAEAPVLVTANYKLSFDHVRESLAGMDAWLLVLDTHGINVWCAAGKGTFGTAELVQRVLKTGLAQVVRHRRLILPQLGATGVAGHRVKKECGFEVIWGPVKAADIRAFLSSDHRSEVAMRRVTFTFSERLVLVPVEITLLRKHLVYTLAVLLFLSGIGPHIFSWPAVWQRGVLAVAAVAMGIAAGCIVVPVLLPWIPGRAFALKGIFAGLFLGTFPAAVHWNDSSISYWSGPALLLLTTALSSYLAMNFTGSTPFTSPSGVEKEMRRYMPVQAGMAVMALFLWIGSAFLMK